MTSKPPDPVNQGSLEKARAEIRNRVEHFRKHQAELQAEREARWDRVAADTKDKISKLK